MMLFLLMLVAVVPVMEVGAVYENTWTNTGDQRLDIIEIAKTQIGYTEGTNNDNKYGAYFGKNHEAWCAWFVSWCAVQANISDGILHRQSVASPFEGYFNIPHHHNDKSYFPQPGDIVFYGPNSEGNHYHTGIVETVNPNTGYITTIEGNTNTDGSPEGYIVCRQTRYYRGSSICCYGSPNYQNSAPSAPTYTEPPTAPVVSVDKKIGLVNEDITISFSAERVSYYWIGIYCDGDLYTNVNVYDNEYIISYPWVGKYDIVVEAKNNCGSKTGYASFKLGHEGDYIPSDFSVSTDKSIAYRNEPITFTFSADDADRYWIGIYTSGNYCYVSDNVSGNTYSVSLPWVGNYHATIVAINDCSSTTKYLNLSVAENDLGEDFYAIIENKTSGKWLTDRNYNVQGESPACARNQIWHFIRHEDSSYSILCNDTYAMDIANISTTAGANLQMVYYAANAAQRFYVFHKDGGYFFRSSYADLWIDMDQSDNNAAMWNCALNSAPQTFDIIKVNKDYTHTWNSGTITKAATCSATGVKTYTCTVCNATKTETIAVSPNNHVNTTNTAATASTCTAKGYTAGVYCNDCKKYISGHAEQPLAAHQPTTQNAKAATCTAEGYTGDQVCTVCKQKITKGTAIAKKAHTLTTINQKSATCTAAGYTGDQYCTTCNQTISRGSATNALGHANADSNGNCTRCGQHIKDVPPSQPSNPQPNPNTCKYCGQVHTGPFGWLIKFFHSILAIFKR